MFEQICLIIISLVLLYLFIFTIRTKKDTTFSIKILTYSSFCICIAFVLSYIRLFPLPQGGSVNPGSMFFITIIGYWFGLKPGILTGITFGLLKLVFNPFIVHPIQFLLDYPLAFGALGISGLFRNGKYELYKGYVVACLSRLLISTLSGIIFFSTFAGDVNPILYSLTYNMSYILPEMILTIVIISVPTYRNAINSVKIQT